MWLINLWVIIQAKYEGNVQVILNLNLFYCDSFACGRFVMLCARIR